MQLEFATAGRVIFGSDEFKQLGDLAAGFGERVFVLTGATSAHQSGLIERLDGLLAARMLTTRKAEIDREPTVSLVDAISAGAREFNPSCIIALGGGSVLDVAKAVGCLLTNGGSVEEYLEGLAAPPRAIEKPSVPVIAVPTTAGTGSEVTKNAVIRADDGSFKKSTRSPLMRPAIAVVDPMLSATMPPAVTAASGMDAQTQLIEAFTSRRAGILTDGLVREGLSLISTALEQAYSNPNDLAARESMAMASLLSGMALDNAGLGAVHGLASPIGAMFEIPHGVICANLLPEITEANIECARNEDPTGKTVRKYQDVARMLTGDSEGMLKRLVTTLRIQRRTLRIPPLGTFGFSAEDIPRILAGCRAGSMNTNPIHLEDAVLAEAVRAAIDA